MVSGLSLVKYNPDTGNITGFIQNLKTLFEVKPPTEETLQWFRSLDTITDKTAIDLTKAEKTFNVTEDSAIKFATAVKNGSVQLEEGQSSFLLLDGLLLSLQVHGFLVSLLMQ